MKPIFWIICNTSCSNTYRLVPFKLRAPRAHVLIALICVHSLNLGRILSKLTSCMGCVLFMFTRARACVYRAHMCDFAKLWTDSLHFCWEQYESPQVTWERTVHVPASCARTCERARVNNFKIWHVYCTFSYLWTECLQTWWWHTTDHQKLHHGGNCRYSLFCFMFAMGAKIKIK
jgi:hypothetical protein